MNIYILLTQTAELIGQGYPLIMAIPAGTDSAEQVLPFQYTIGMHDLGYPELVITGLPVAEGQEVLMKLLTDFQTQGVLRSLGYNFNLLDRQIAKVVRIENSPALPAAA